MATLDAMAVAPDSTGKSIRLWRGTDGTFTEIAVLGDPEGNQVGTFAAPLRVDPTGTTPQPVTGTFWQATQPVSGTFWQATQPVSGTFWQATQPVSIAATVATDEIDRPGRLVGIVYGTVGQIVQRAVSGDLQTQLRTAGTEYDARQIRTLTASDSVDVSDRAGRLVGVVYGSQGQQLLQRAVSFDLQVQLRTAAAEYDARQIRALTSADVVDVSDRAGRLVGVVYGSQGQQLKQTATNFNAQVELATGGTLYDARQIRTLTASDGVLVLGGDVDHDAVNTLKVVQVGGHASPSDTFPTAISTTADRARIWVDQYGRQIVTTAKRATYSALYRLAVTNAEAALTFTHVANTDKQYATIYHAGTAVKTVKIRAVYVWIYNVATAAGIFFVELRRLNLTTAPATGNPVITPLALAPADAAAETTCLALPTTAGSEAAANSPVNSIRVDYGITAAGPTTNPPQPLNPIVLYEEKDDIAPAKNLQMRNGVAEGYAVIVRSSAASVTRFMVQIIFTEETP